MTTWIVTKEQAELLDRLDRDMRKCIDAKDAAEARFVLAVEAMLGGHQDGGTVVGIDVGKREVELVDAT